MAGQFVAPILVMLGKETTDSFTFICRGLGIWDPRICKYYKLWEYSGLVGGGAFHSPCEIFGICEQYFTAFMVYNGYVVDVDKNM